MAEEEKEERVDYQTVSERVSAGKGKVKVKEGDIVTIVIRNAEQGDGRTIESNVKYTFMAGDLEDETMRLKGIHETIIGQYLGNQVTIVCPINTSYDDDRYRLPQDQSINVFETTIVYFISEIQAADSGCCECTVL